MSVQNIVTHGICSLHYNLRKTAKMITDISCDDLCLLVGSPLHLILVLDTLNIASGSQLYDMTTPWHQVGSGEIYPLCRSKTYHVLNVDFSSSQLESASNWVSITLQGHDRSDPEEEAAPWTLLVVLNCRIHAPLVDLPEAARQH